MCISRQTDQWDGWRGETEAKRHERSSTLQGASRLRELTAPHVNVSRTRETRATFKIKRRRQVRRRHEPSQQSVPTGVLLKLAPPPRHIFVTLTEQQLTLPRAYLLSDSPALQVPAALPPPWSAGGGFGGGGKFEDPLASTFSDTSN